MDITIEEKTKIVNDYFKDFSYVKFSLKPTNDKLSVDKIIEDLYCFVDSRLNHPEHFTKYLHISE